MSEYNLQVDAAKYLNENYLGAARFLGYHEQLMSVFKLKDVKTIAEIGPGNGVTTALLRHFGYEVQTIDFDYRLSPDIECSILQLQERVHQTFDVVLCFEVLEHLEFEDFEAALQNLNAITNQYLILSLPYVGYTIKFLAYLSRLGERKIEFIKRIPPFWKTHVFNGEHYWEIGKKGYSRRKIREVLSRHFQIHKEWLFTYNHSQLFYQCQKK